MVKRITTPNYSWRSR